MQTIDKHGITAKIKPAAATGKYGIAASLGIGATAMAGDNGWIVLAAYNDQYELICVKTAKVGGSEGIEPNVAYSLSPSGDFVPHK